MRRCRPLVSTIAWALTSTLRHSLSPRRDIIGVDFGITQLLIIFMCSSLRWPPLNLTLCCPPLRAHASTTGSVGFCNCLDLNMHFGLGLCFELACFGDCRLLVPISANMDLEVG